VFTGRKADRQCSAGTNSKTVRRLIDLYTARSTRERWSSRGGPATQHLWSEVRLPESPNESCAPAKILLVAAGHGDAERSLRWVVEADRGEQGLRAFECG
jgi:hypothetical protein